jgi:chromosome segregation ATPase
MDCPASPLAAERSSVMSRLAELDLIIKQTQQDLHETLQLIDRLREHYLHIQDKLSDAESEQASLLTRATRLWDAGDLIEASRTA